jgi:hypothetical protein
MRPSLRVRLALAFVAGMATVPAAFWAMRARAQDAPRRPEAQASQDPRLSGLLALATTAFGGFGGGGRDDQPAPPPSVVHVVAPITSRAAKTWEKLHTIVDLKFPKEVSLDDFLAAVRKATKGPNDKGVQIYVGLAEWPEGEKTLAGVRVDLEDVPVSTVLALVLKQLSLKFYVQQDGIVMITSESDEDSVADPSAKLLDEVSTLRVELATLRRELGLLRDAPKRASQPPATAGSSR